MHDHTLKNLSQEELIALCEIYAKNWLALDGLWFQSIEAKYGLAEALEHDANAWRRFTVIEAQRIKTFLQLPEQGGLEGLQRALALRLCTPLNQDEIIVQDNTLTYRIITCRVQEARNRKNMPCHPCKPVGLIEYTYFAQTIDPRITTEALSCHPDVTDPSCHCSWKFTLQPSAVCSPEQP